MSRISLREKPRRALHCRAADALEIVAELRKRDAFHEGRYHLVAVCVPLLLRAWPLHVLARGQGGRSLRDGSLDDARVGPVGSRPCSHASSAG